MVVSDLTFADIESHIQEYIYYRLPNGNHIMAPKWWSWKVNGKRFTKGERFTKS